MITSLLLPGVLGLLPLAQAGYADAEASEQTQWDGEPTVETYPNWEERDLHLWTNAARVDPEAFAEAYSAGGCSFDDFEASEQTPKKPLYFDVNLNYASRYHARDMGENNHFSHDSSDGTDFGTRVSWWYDSGFVGENIAYGYGSGFNTMMVGWMCSSGHRANIMTESYTELGTGVLLGQYVQDFGGGTIDSDGKMAMGSHLPGIPVDGEVVFYVDFADESPPDSIEVVLEGVGTPMELEYGVPEQGVYATLLPVEDGPGADDLDKDADFADCYEYYFRWSRGTDDEGNPIGGVWPETGSYLFGKNCSHELMWIERQGDAGIALDFEDDSPRIIGCAAVPSPASSLLGGLAGLALLGLRRRR